MTIEELLWKLDYWRKNKINHLDRIPKEYWEAAIKLAANTSPSAKMDEREKSDLFSLVSDPKY